MNVDGDVIRSLLSGDPEQIAAAGLVGMDADSRLSPEILRSLEAAGYKEPGVPMTVTQLARALVAGVIPSDTQIVRRVR
jgi:hypothetical protein